MKKVYLLLALAIPLAVLVTQRTLGAQRPELWAFTGPWDEASDASVLAHGGRVDALVTGWIGLDSASAMPMLPSAYPDTLRIRGRRAPRRMAIVTSWHNDRFHAGTVRRLARNAGLLGRAAGAAARHAATMGYRGMVLDFEALEPGDVDALVRVARAFTDSAHARRVPTVALAIPAADTFSYPTRPLAGAADLLLVMLYDQHWAASAPGAVAEPEWVRAALARRIADAGGVSRIVAGLPTYGYRWNAGQPGEQLSFVEAKRFAARAGAPLRRDPRTRSLTASRAGAWELWVTDAAALSALLAETRRAGVRRVALWRLGQEDSAIWPVLGR